MNIVFDDEELRKLLTEEQIKALGRLREYALLMHCRTVKESMGMMSANSLPVSLKLYGLSWMRLKVQEIVTLLSGRRIDVRRTREAAKQLLALL